ncbi:MAG: PepSY-associated TM helix domain-containing protein, partial [Ilumatobacteraceae bacterium]
ARSRPHVRSPATATSIHPAGTSTPASTTKPVFQWMYRGHMYLWQDHGIGNADALDGWCHNAPGGVTGIACTLVPSADDGVAWLAVSWMVVLLTGFYLWYWPGIRQWASVLRVRRSRGRFTFHLDLHTSIGVVVSTPPADGAEPLTLGQLEAAIHDRYAVREIQAIASLAPGETDTYAAWLTRGYDLWTREGGAGNVDTVFDRYSGATLYDGTPEELSIGGQVRNDWSYPMHTGEFLGRPGRMIWVLLSLSPLVLAITGVTMTSSVVPCAGHEPPLATAPQLSRGAGRRSLRRCPSR